MRKNKRGLSAVVTTLLIILLTVIAVGIIWVVINNLIGGGGKEIDLNALCAAAMVDVIATKPGAGSYEIVYSVERVGERGIDGVKVVLFDNAGNATAPKDYFFSSRLTTMQTGKITVTDLVGISGASNVAKIKYLLIFNDSTTNTPRYCGKSVEKYVG